MTAKRVVATSTHFDVQDAVKVPDSDSAVENNQEGQLLIDPEDFESGSTHVTAKRLKASDPLTDQELKGPTITHTDNETDPSTGYLQADEEEELPVEEVPETSEEFEVEGEKDEEVADDIEDMEEDVEDAEDDDEAVEEEAAEMCSDDSGEFDDLSADFGGEDLADDQPEVVQDLVEDAEEAAADAENSMDSDADMVEEFEEETASDEVVPLVDADAMSDDGEMADDLQFATIANAVHVIRSNRIIASMGLVTAKKAGVDDVYMTEQFQDVVVANVESKGLRKGLVQSGFILAKVKLTASKASAKVIKAKVEAGLSKKIEAMETQRKAMEQSLAIAAVGINRRFFKDVNNELKANLEAELVHAGVRGGQNIVRAMFAKYGVSYAKSILTLATKISAMPEEMRDQYAEALDMTEDDFSDEVDSDMEEDFEETEEDFEPIPATVSAALRSPVRRDVGVLLKSSTAMSILNGSQSLV